MSNPHHDLINKSLLLGQAMGDLSRARGSEAIAVLQSGTAERKAREAARALEDEREAHEETKKQLAQSQEMILEWMLSNQSFLRLSRKYGKALGLSDEQRREDNDEVILDIVEEDPKYAKTKLAADARAALAKKMK